MFSSLSLPKFFPPTRPAHLYLAKALLPSCLVSLNLLLLSPAQAQGQGGGWSAVPCDASGNILSNPSSNNDGYVMGGTESGSDSTTCPLFQSYDTASTPYNNAPVPSGIGNYGSGGNEALVTNGSDYFWYGQVYGTNTYATQNGTETVDLNGQLVYYFKEVWQGSGAPTTPMPDHIDLRLKTRVSAFAYVYYGNTGLTSGLSGQASASDGDPFNETATASVNTPDASVLYQEVDGSHLVRASVSGGIATVYLNGQTHMEANNAVPYGVLSYPMPSDPSYVEGTVTNGSTQARSNSLVACSVRQDSREVSITCPTIEDSYYKGSYDSQHGTDKYDHLRDPITGAIVTDSAVTYQNASGGGVGGAGTAQGWQVNNIALTANAPGFNSPTYQWSLSGPSQAFLTVPTANPVSYSLLEPNTDKFPLQGTVKVTVTDSDGASAANTFGITWHLPYEENELVGTVYSKSAQGEARVGPVYDGQTLLVQQTQPFEIDWGATIDGASAIAAGTGQEEIAGGLEILGNLAKVTNWKTEVGPENSYDGATNGPTTWSDANTDNNEIYGDGNIPAGLIGNSDGWQLCKMYIYQYAHYKDTSWYADGYNVHGYDGNSQHVLLVHAVDSVYDEFVFVQYRNPDGSPVS